MKNKRYAVSDIHGNHKALVQVLSKSKFDYAKDELIVVGDVCDGYSDSYEVVEELLKIKNVVYIIGNHDVWWMNHMANGWADMIWTSQGGRETITSYESNGYHYGKLPQRHKDFFNNGKYWYEVDGMLFVHGGFDYPKHPKDCDPEDLVWDRELLHRCRNDLKIKEWEKVFLGHTTSEREGAKPIIMNFWGDEAAKVIQLDCGAGWKGRLCLYDIDTDEYVLSDYAHELNIQDKRKNE